MKPSISCILVLLACFYAQSRAQVANSPLQVRSDGTLTFNGRGLSRDETVIETRTRPETPVQLMNAVRGYFLRHSWSMIAYDTSSLFLKAKIVQQNAFNEDRILAEFYFQPLLHTYPDKSVMICALKFSYFSPKGTRGKYVEDAPFPAALEETGNLMYYSMLYDALEHNR